MSLSLSENYLCTSCLSRMPRTLYHRQPDNPMEQRFMGIIPYERATGHFFYSRGSDLALLIHDFKYHRFRGLARHLGALVANELLPTGFLNDVDVIMPVPMHFLKRARRGYNQAREIACGVADVARIPLGDNLKALRGHRTQTSMSLAGRHKNIEGVFYVDHASDLQDKSILIIDDVCTTGATLISAVETISAVAPTARFSLLTLGVTF